MSIAPLPPSSTPIPPVPTTVPPSMTPRATPPPSRTIFPTASAYPQLIEPRKEKTYTVFIAVVVAVIIIVVAIVVAVAVLRKKNDRIYPKAENEEKEPEGISVTIERIYKERQVIP